MDAGQRRSAAFGLAAALLAACSRTPAEPGLHFESTLADVGRMFAGPSVPIEFRFVNGPVPVEIHDVATSCGCLDPQVWIGEERLALPGVVPAGATGVVRTEYRTEGYSGRKKSGLTLRGPGPGLPAELIVDSILDTWLQVEPEVAQFGVVDGVSERILRVVVRGREPFRLVEPVIGSPGIQVRGAPSAGVAAQHELEVVLEPSGEEGPHAAFLNLIADNGWSVRLPVAWNTEGPLYVTPHRLLPLPRMRPGVAVSVAIEVGARVGTLEPPEVEIRDLAGVKTSVRTVQEGSRYRIDLTLPADLPVGAVSGWARILLRHRLDGEVQEVTREVRFLGVVQADSSP